MGWPELPGLCILGSRYKDGVRDSGLMSKEISVLDRLWGGPAVEMRLWRS